MIQAERTASRCDLATPSAGSQPKRPRGSLCGSGYPLFPMCKWHSSPKGRNDLSLCLEKPRDTVGECKSAEMGVPHMPAWRAKKRGKLTQENVLLEP